MKLQKHINTKIQIKKDVKKIQARTEMMKKAK